MTNRTHMLHMLDTHLAGVNAAIADENPQAARSILRDLYRCAETLDRSLNTDQANQQLELGGYPFRIGDTVRLKSYRSTPAHLVDASRDFGWIDYGDGTKVDVQLTSLVKVEEPT